MPKDQYPVGKKQPAVNRPVAMSRELDERVRKVAEAEGRSVSNLLRFAATLYVQQAEQQREG